MTEEFVRLVNEFERDCPGWTWLVRNNDDPGEAGGYFVNLRPPRRPNDRHYAAFPSYGPTPEAAFIAALFKVSRHLAGRGLKSVPHG